MKPQTPVLKKNEAPELLKIGPLTFTRHADSAHTKRPLWAWYGGEAVTQAELKRRARALIDGGHIARATA